MKTDELIEKLAHGKLQVAAPMSDRAFVVAFSAILFLFTGLSLFLLPIRPDLNLQLQHGYFYSETLVWLGLFVVAGVTAYRSGLPSVPLEPFQRIFFGLFALLSIGLAARAFLWPAPDTFVDELELFRGRCGGLILSYGLVAGFAFMIWLRTKAPVRPRSTALWVGLATTTWGSFVMQFVCYQENPVHVVLWHFLPIAALSAGLAYFGRRLVRW